MKWIVPLGAVAIVAACSQHSSKIEPTYVSPNVYAGRTCQQLVAERNQIVHQVNSLTEKQNEAATNDAVLTGAALVLFWPAALFVGVTGDHADTLGAAKGNYDAITAQMRAKDCTEA